MAASNHLEAGLFTREPGTARGWVEVSRGVAAAVYGPAAPAYAHDVFGQLARLSEVSAPAADAAYPSRVVEAAQVLESLHRELWQMQGGDEPECGLGAGVLVFEPERAYFLQVGGVLLYQRRDGRLTEVATAHNASPLLGAAVKSGIRVHTLSASVDDAFVIVASNVEAPLDADAIESCLGGAGDIESAAEAMGALVDVAADGCTVVTVGVTTPVQAPPPESPAAAVGGTDWSFEGDVVGELSAFMEGLAEERTTPTPDAESVVPEAEVPETDVPETDAPETDAPETTGGVLHGDDAAVHAAELHGALTDRKSGVSAAREDDEEDEDAADEGDLPDAHSDTGPAFVPPAVHPMDRRTDAPDVDEEEDPSLDPFLDGSHVHEEEVGSDAFARSAEASMDVPESAPEADDAVVSEVADISGGDDTTDASPAWAESLERKGDTAAKTRRRPVTSYKLTVLTLLLLLLPAAGWLFRDPVLAWWHARSEAPTPPAESTAPDPVPPADAAPPVAFPDTSEALLDSARVSAITLTGPRGGRVWVDGTLVPDKETPVSSLALAPGEHEVRVVYERLGEWRARVTMPTDEAVVDATPFGTIRLDYGDQPLADVVRLDGTSLGRDPRSPVRVRAGDHVVQLGEDESLARRVFVAGGDTVHVSLPAAPAGKGLLVAESRRFVGDGFDPSENDSVWVNRAFVGSTPLERPLAPGVYSVRVSRKGESHIRIVDIVPDAVRVVRADFGSEARLSLRHTPEAEVRAGEPLFLATHVDETDRPSARRLFCLYRVRDGTPFRSREMRRVQETSTYWVASVPEAETSAGWVQYYFTAIDADGVQIVSEMFEVGTPRKVASR